MLNGRSAVHIYLKQMQKTTSKQSKNQTKKNVPQHLINTKKAIEISQGQSQGQVQNCILNDFFGVLTVFTVNRCNKAKKKKSDVKLLHPIYIYIYIYVYYKIWDFAIFTVV